MTKYLFLTQVLPEHYSLICPVKGDALQHHSWVYSGCIGNSTSQTLHTKVTVVFGLTFRKCAHVKGAFQIKGN